MAVCVWRFLYLALTEGGVRGWSDAGLELFKGENALAKGFAEWLEKAYQTPTIYADELSARLDAGEDIAVLDCRTPDQFRDFHIPAKDEFHGFQS